MSSFRPAVAIVMALAASCVQPTNGFDPDAPAELAARATLQGTIALEDPDPTDAVVPSPAGVTIAVVGGPSTTAAADGSFTLGEVEAGLRTVRFTFAGYVGAETTVVTERAKTTTLSPRRLELTRTLVTGSVDLLGAIDDGGALVEADGFGARDVTGADGRFSLVVPVGTATTVDLKASRGGFASQRVTVAIDGDVVVAPDIVLAPNLGRLVVNDGATITNAATVTLNLDVAGAARVRASENPAFVEGDAAVAFVAYPANGDLPFTLSEGDGAKEIFVQVEDAAGDVVLLEGGIELDTTPPVLTSVVVDDGSGVTASVSVTVSVAATDASEMVIATDGVVDGELFGPLAPTAIALLPAGDGEKNVCVIVRDAADNRAGPLCATVELDGSRPSSPQVLEDTVQVIPPARARAFDVPIIVPDDDVVALQVSVEPQGTSARLTRDALDGVVGLAARVPVDLAVPAVFPDVVFIGRVVRLRFEDAAGNLSEETTLTIRIDGLPPKAPEIAERIATRVSGCDGDGDLVVYEASGRDGAIRRVNADTFVVSLKRVVRDLDVNFDRFEVAQTIGLDVTPAPNRFTASASVDNILFALVQGAPGNGVEPQVGCSPAACLNHLFVRAFDEAGNESPLVRLDVIEDSTPPTRPALTPRDVTLRGGSARIALATPSQDRVTIDLEDVSAYEIKEGIDGTFEGIPDGQPPTGPWELALAPSASNEVCVRGVDEAGNVGIEDCVTVVEDTVRFAVQTSLSDSRQAIAGDHILYARGPEVRLTSVVKAAATDDEPGLLLHEGIGDIGLPRLVQVPTPTGLRIEAVHGGSRPAATGDGIHYVSIGLDDVIEKRFLCGSEADFDGQTGVWLEQGQLKRASRTEMRAAPVSTSGNCTSVGSIIAPLPAPCTFTRAEVSGDDVIWCEVNGQVRQVRHHRQGDIRTISTAAAEAQQGILTGGLSRTIQPLVDDGLLLWGEGSPPTLRILPATRPAADAIDTGIEIATLLDADEGRVLVQVLTDDALGTDIAVIDARSFLGPDPLPLVKLTDEIAPQDLGSLSGFRASWVDLSSFTEDIAVADLSTERPIAGTPEFDISPETSPQRSAWFAVADGGLAVLSLDHDTGAERVELRGDEVSFSGGTVLGRATIAVGGDLVVGARRGPNDRWVLQARVAAQAPPVVLAIDVRNAESTTPLGQEANAAWGLDEDGRALVYADGVGVRFQGLPATLPNTFTPSPQTLPGVGTTAAYIDVDIDDATGDTVVVLQQRAEPNNNADLRREGTGPIAVVRGSLVGSTLTAATGAVVRLGVATGPALVGRSPQVAVVGTRTFLTLLRDTQQDARPRLQPVSCELVFGAAPFCPTLEPLGLVNDQAPELSGEGLAISITVDPVRGGGVGDVVVTNLLSRQQVLLTGPIDGVAPRQTARIAGRRAVWADARLGSFDIWEAFLP